METTMSRNPMAGSLKHFRQQIVPDKRGKLLGEAIAASFEACVMGLDKPLDMDALPPEAAEWLEYARRSWSDAR
jgi:hypothetical protein